MQVTKENYAQIAQEKKNIVLSYAKSDEGWSQVRTKDGVVVSKRKTDDSSHILVRGQGLVNGTVDSILGRISGLEYQKILDTTLKSVKDVEALDDNNKIVHQQNKMPSPLTDRDFVTFQHRESTADQAVTCAVSTVHDKVPVDKHYVRGEVMIGGFVVEKVDDKQCKVTYVIQVDLKGNVPTFATNSAALDQGLTVLNLRKAMEGASASN